MTLQQSQIKTRYKLYSIFLFAYIALTLAVSIITGIFFGFADGYKNVLDNIFSDNSSSSSILLVLGILSLLLLISSFVSFVFKLMLIHGIFSILRRSTDSKVNPTFAVWTNFIPIFYHFKHPLNLINAYKNLKIPNSTLPKTFLYLCVIIGIPSIVQAFFDYPNQYIVSYAVSVITIIIDLSELMILKRIKHGIIGNNNDKDTKSEVVAI